ncbi:hypothetical protein O0I10_002895 [Lichtheimia ornata]|uniref:Homeobox domain-containing protein n=1 Tax=Lichtheimia ornata TaxID=688661 RepID=A0AAD7Y1J3_9FUNG|nr:uncharacterized protein O0I10_002895 [Lichtheimia ornata]KAJ8661148.1 hypothetical protein O0I10_002895 [Lichtheimia ornata]
MFQAPSGVSLSTPARRRPRTNQQQLAILTDFYWNITAYPNRQQLQQLAQQLGFGHDSVNTWFQNQRQSLRRNGRDDRLIQTGHRRSSIQNPNQNQTMPLSTGAAAAAPAAPLLNNPTMADAYDDDDDPPSDDPPSDEQVQFHHSSQEEEDNNNRFHHQQNDPPLYRPIPHHATTMNPFADASPSRPIQHPHTSAFTTNTAITATGSGSGGQMHHQAQHLNMPQQPQQHHAGKTTTAAGKQPLDFFFYHYDYPMQSIAEAKLLDHPSTSSSQQQQHQ